MATQSKDSTVFTPGARVTRTIGPLLTGMVVEPTQADKARGMYSVWAPGELDQCVLVQWGYWRSWEYCSDLRSIPGTPGDL